MSASWAAFLILKDKPNQSRCKKSSPVQETYFDKAKEKFVVNDCHKKHIIN